MIRVGIFALLSTLAVPAAAAETPEDVFAACVIGKGAVLMNQQADMDTAFNVAWAECQPLAAAIVQEHDGEGFDGLDGIEEYVYMILSDIAD